VLLLSVSAQVHDMTVPRKKSGGPKIGGVKVGALCPLRIRFCLSVLSLLLPAAVGASLHEVDAVLLVVCTA
jgi:hypothetical protein